MRTHGFKKWPMVFQYRQTSTMQSTVYHDQDQALAHHVTGGGDPALPAEDAPREFAGLRGCRGGRRLRSPSLSPQSGCSGASD